MSRLIVGFARVAVIAAGCLAATVAAAQPLASLREAQATPDKAARSQIRIVGSTSMEDLTQIVVKALVKKWGIQPPIVEKSGSREGVRLFCAGIGLEFPDIAASSRRITQSEFNACIENGILDIIEVAVALDGIVVVTEKGDPVFNITPRHIYLALAAEVPRKFVLGANLPPEVARAAEAAEGEDFIQNPFKSWRQVDSRLPNVPIRVYGPERGSGTRQFINDMLFESGCRGFREIRNIYGAADRVRQCITKRTDGAWVDVAEPFADKVIEAVVKDDVGTLGFVPQDVYDLDKERVDQLPVLGQLATHETIASGEYPLRRRMYYYVKRAHMRNAQGVGIVRGLREFLAEVTSEEMIGPDGLFHKVGGVVALPEEEREESRRNASILRRLER
ncbi:MAG: substrate-binding domain-containing protein [Proteobacteria bacterium]|nr:substrate-binding domain-containing protein [Pseudomonadota bacterium]